MEYNQKEYLKLVEENQSQLKLISIIRPFFPKILLKHLENAESTTLLNNSIKENLIILCVKIPNFFERLNNFLINEQSKILDTFFRSFVDNLFNYSGDIIYFYGRTLVTVFNNYEDAIDAVLHFYKQFEVQNNISMTYSIDTGEIFFDLIQTTGNYYYNISGSTFYNCIDRLNKGEMHQLIISDKSYDIIKNNQRFYFQNIKKFDDYYIYNLINTDKYIK